MTAPILPQRALNRALLARQLLLDRVDLPITDALEQVGGLQTQYAPSGYVSLWTRLRDFERGALTAALEDRSVVQATLMRTTIHMVSRREFWAYALGVREARRVFAQRVLDASDYADLMERAERVRAALADGPRTVKELGEAGFVGNLGMFVDLARVPPSGTWHRRRADRLALAEDWVGPPDSTERAGREHLVRAYLRAFGPAPWRDIASWAGLPVTDIKAAGEGMALVDYRDIDGRPLVDLPDAPLPDPDTPAPVRFLPHWEATLLVHARRTGLLPERHRPRVFHTRDPFSVGTVLVDGHVAAAWSVRDGRIVVDPFERLPPDAGDAIEAERAALEAFHA